MSPAVIVPCLFRLREKGYGVSKGIPTLVLAVSGVDDAASVAVFGIVSSIMFSASSLTMNIIQVKLLPSTSNSNRAFFYMKFTLIIDDNRFPIETNSTATKKSRLALQFFSLGNFKENLKMYHLLLNSSNFLTIY